MAWMIYLAEMSGNVQALAIVAAFAATVIGAIFAMFGLLDEDPQTTALAKPFIVLAFVSGLVVALTPSATTIYMIAGASIAEAQITSPEGQEIIGKVGKLIDLKLDEALAGASK